MEGVFVTCLMDYRKHHTINVTSKRQIVLDNIVQTLHALIRNNDDMDFAESGHYKNTRTEPKWKVTFKWKSFYQFKGNVTFIHWRCLVLPDYSWKYVTFVNREW